MTHEIPKNTLNSNVEYCIDEYVRLRWHRELLRDKWFEGLSLKELADKYRTTDTTVKKVLYDIGDDVLIRAANMQN